MTAVADPGVEAFKSTILGLFFQDVHRVVPNPEYQERFGAEKAGQFDLGKHVFYLDWFFRNCKRLSAAYDLFADEASRALFLNLIRYRLSGQAHVRIDSHLPSLADEASDFKALFDGAPSELATNGRFGHLLHYDQEWKGVRYTVDTIKHSMMWSLVYRQYFLDRGGVRIRPEPGDFVVDSGAFTGDTAVVFSRAVGPSGRVFAFEPVASHVEVCRHNFSRPEYENITLLPYGISDRSVEAPPADLPDYDPGWRVHGAVPLARLDDLVINGRIPKVDFIKLDVEGSELAAMRGAAASLHRFKPKLALSLYHNPDDYFEIIEFLHGLGLGYRFYLGQYTMWEAETVLYAAAS